MNNKSDNKKLNGSSLLIIDDDKDICRELGELFAQDNLKIFCALDGARANEIIAKNHVDVVLLDLKLPDINGLDLISVIKNVNRDAEIIVITGYGSLDTATRAMKENVYDYVTKPFDPARLEITVKEAFAKIKMKKELEGKMEDLEKFKKLTIGRELEMIKLKEEIDNLKKGIKNNK